MAKNWWIPESLRGYKRQWLTTDILAGITLAAVALPECMGYTKIAGTPVITGLYTILLPVLVFAWLGSSKHLVVGADSATAAILYGGLILLAKPNSADWLALASLAAFLTGVLLLLARIFRLGFLSAFMSRTVLVGFLSGVGLSLIFGELPGMLGIEAGNGSVVDKMGNLATRLPQANFPTLILAGGVIAAVLGTQRFSRKIPISLIAVALAIAVTWIFRLEQYGVAIVGSVKAGLPAFRLPPIKVSLAAKLFPTCGSMFLVILAQSAATARSFAQKHEEHLDENKDLLALAGANFAASVSSTFVVNGSPTKTAIVESAGARTQAAQLTMAAIVLAVLLFATELIAHLPEAALAALVFLIGLDLIDLASLRSIWRFRRLTFAVAVITMLGVVFLGVEKGIFLAIILSVIDHLRQEYHPKDVVLQLHNEIWRAVPAKPGMESEPGLLIYRFEAPLFFANVDYFAARVKAMRKAAPHPLKWLVIDMVSMDDIDFTATESLRRVVEDLQNHDITVAIAEAEDVRSQIRHAGILNLVGSDHVFESLHEAAEAFQKTS